MGKAESIMADAVKESGMTIKAVSVKTGIPYGCLQPSLKGYLRGRLHGAYRTGHDRR